ncbi:hypothetical protein [Vibrio phage RYC]|nr:hypothetical protein [Vibrio phage RYC]
MAPAKADPETQDIEAFAHAMEHYAKRGCDKVIVQPKFMGSRAQVYLWRDVEKCYAISRKGFLIRGLDLKEAFEDLIKKTLDKDCSATIEHIIVDAELMPWASLGGNLIEDQFEAFEDVVMNELGSLCESGFYVAHKRKTEEGKEDAGTSIVVSSIDEAKFLEKFNEQVSLFGKGFDEENGDRAYFEPFNILKMVDVEGKEYMTMHANHFNSIQLGTEFVTVNPNDWESDENLLEFLENIKGRQLEGVVVKPAFFKWEEESQYAPYLKVRNPDYLRIVYGHDYTVPAKLERLVLKKSIGKKVGASLKDYRLGEKMLTIPTKLIDSKNEEYKETIAQLVQSGVSQQELDPRL